MDTVREPTSQKSKKSVTEKVRRIVFVSGQIFCAVSFVRLVRRKLVACALMALLSMVLLCIPMLIERYFHCNIVLPVYLIMLVYTLGSLLGDGYDLYHLTSWWDKLMHLSGGVIFAMFGAFLADVLSPDAAPSLLMRAIFALCFSVAVSAAWEIFEYAADLLFHADMQNDTIITEINSYLIGSKLGQIGHIPEITSVTVNSQPMQGYIDIGLIDTMRDMIIETLGAAAYVIWFSVDKDRHPVFVKLT